MAHSLVGVAVFHVVGAGLVSSSMNEKTEAQEEEIIPYNNRQSHTTLISYRLLHSLLGHLTRPSGSPRNGSPRSDLGFPLRTMVHTLTPEGAAVPPQVHHP